MNQLLNPNQIIMYSITLKTTNNDIYLIGIVKDYNLFFNTYLKERPSHKLILRIDTKLAIKYDIYESEITAKKIENDITNIFTLLQDDAKYYL